MRRAAGGRGGLGHRPHPAAVHARLLGAGQLGAAAQHHHTGTGEEHASVMEAARLVPSLVTSRHLVPRGR